MQDAHSTGFSTTVNSSHNGLASAIRIRSGISGMDKLIHQNDDCGLRMPAEQSGKKPNIQSIGVLAINALTYFESLDFS